MTYFRKADAVDVRQVVDDKESVIIYGVPQEALRGDWVITRRDGKITIWGDDAFRKSFVQLPD